MISSPTLDRLLEPKYKYERREGRKDEVKELIRKKLAKNKPVEIIADDLEENDIDKVRSLIDEIKEEDAAASNVH